MKTKKAQSAKPEKRTGKRKITAEEEVANETLINEVMSISRKNEKEEVPESSARNEISEVKPSMPDGWKREEVIRKKGKTAGLTDVYYYSPEGVKLRSKPEVAAYIKKHDSPVSLSDFNFGKKVPNKQSKVVPAKVVPAKVVPAKVVPAKVEDEENDDGSEQESNVDEEESKDEEPEKPAKKARASEKAVDETPTCSKKSSLKEENMVQIRELKKKRTKK